MCAIFCFTNININTHVLRKQLIIFTLTYPERPTGRMNNRKRHEFSNRHMATLLALILPDFVLPIVLEGGMSQKGKGRYLGTLPYLKIIQVYVWLFCGEYWLTSKLWILEKVHTWSWLIYASFSHLVLAWSVTKIVIVHLYIFQYMFTPVPLQMKQEWVNETHFQFEYNTK